MCPTHPFVVRSRAAMPSSPINIAGRQPSLMQVLSTVPDPRCARGMRHRLEVILAVAVGAVLSGARSLLAIGPDS